MIYPFCRQAVYHGCSCSLPTACIYSVTVSVSSCCHLLHLKDLRLSSQIDTEPFHKGPCRARTGTSTRWRPSRTGARAFQTRLELHLVIRMQASTALQPQPQSAAASGAQDRIFVQAHLLDPSQKATAPPAFEHLNVSKSHKGKGAAEGYIQGLTQVRLAVPWIGLCKRFPGLTATRFCISLLRKKLACTAACLESPAKAVSRLQHKRTCHCLHALLMKEH